MSKRRVEKVVSAATGCLEVSGSFIEDVVQEHQIKDLTKDDLHILYVNIKEIRDELWAWVRKVKRDEFVQERWNQLIAVEFILRLVRDYITAEDIGEAMKKYDRRNRDD